VGPRAGLERCGKSRPPPGFDPRTVQPVASRYTDYATRPTGCTRLRKTCVTMHVIFFRYAIPVVCVCIYIYIYMYGFFKISHNTTCVLA